MALTRLLTAWVLGAALLLPMASARAAESDPFDGRLLPIELIMAFRTEVDLTAAQRRAIGELVVDLQKTVAEHQWHMQEAYFELIEALDQPALDEQRVGELAERALRAENQIKLAQIRLLVRARNLLKPDQVAFLRGQLEAGWTKKQE
ncbi:MAG: hypothetical protein RIB46_13845 [Pseudomonadales bacterium]